MITTKHFIRRFSLDRGSLAAMELWDEVRRALDKAGFECQYHNDPNTYLAEVTCRTRDYTGIEALDAAMSRVDANLVGYSRVASGTFTITASVMHPADAYPLVARARARAGVWNQRGSRLTVERAGHYEVLVHGAGHDAFVDMCNTLVTACTLGASSKAVFTLDTANPPEPEPEVVYTGWLELMEGENRG